MDLLQLTPSELFPMAVEASREGDVSLCYLLLDLGKASALADLAVSADVTERIFEELVLRRGAWS